MTHNATFQLHDRVIAVTGAATGIGRAIAAACSDAGAAVYLLDIDRENGSMAAEGVGTFIDADITSRPSIERAFDQIAAGHECLDVLVNNAGGFGSQQTTETLDPAEWDRLVSLNLTSVFTVSQIAIPLLKRSTAGRIINLGSLAGQTAGYRTSPAYAAAKGGVHAFTRVLAHELAEAGITVNAVAPSAVLTERILGLRNEQERQETTGTIPLGRYQTPDELAAWILFLASAESGFMTGETLAVNGGRFMV